MSAKSYLLLCLAVAVAVSVTVLYAPGVGEDIERAVLGFLSRNAR
jgi:hypothetical protein